MDDPLWQKALHYLRLESPAAYKAFVLYQSGVHGDAAAGHLGINRRAYRARMEKARKLMGDYLGLWDMDKMTALQGRQLALKEKQMIMRMFPPS